MSDIATPEMIAAAWDAWKSRPGWKLGPGPGFREAIEAALSVRSTEPELEHHVIADLAARLAKAERERDDLRHDVERHIAASSSEAGSADAAEAKLAKAERALEEAEKVIANERSRATDAEYMAQAYRNMLGDIGMKVADMWRDKGVRRVHFSWSGEAEKLTGEERAKHILEWEYAPSREVDPREIDGASPTVSVEEFVSGMESLPSPPKEG